MSSSNSSDGAIVANNTVKISQALQGRILRAMEAGGFIVWSEFCRVALTEKCKATEQMLLARDAAEYLRI
jgi:hypothetical protein